VNDDTSNTNTHESQGFDPKNQTDRTTQAIHESEFDYQRRQGKSADLSYLKASVAVARYLAPQIGPDSSRLSGHLQVKVRAEKQTRGGKAIDLDVMHRTADIVEKIAQVATPAQNERFVEILSSITTISARKAKPNAGAVNGRKVELFAIRKALRRIIVNRNAEADPIAAESWLDDLIKIEAELACLQGTEDGSMHFESVLDAMPFFSMRKGIDAVRCRLDYLVAHYADLRVEAAVAAIEGNTKVKLPKLLTAVEIVEKYRLKVAELKQVAPHGCFMRGIDRDEVDADLKRQGLFRPKPKKKTREEIGDKANRERDIEMLMKHYHRTRDTVVRWQRGDPEKYAEKLEAAALDEAPEGLTKAIRLALMDYFDVGPAAIRQWDHRKQLAAKLAEFRAATGWP
jgi:hypothetical protein